MFYAYRRFGSRVNLAFAALHQVDLAVPQQPQPVGEIMRNYPNAWVRAAPCAYMDPATGRAYGTLWAWGARWQDSPAAWPVLAASDAGYRIDPQSRGDYAGALFAVGAGPVLVRDGQPVDVPAEIRAGGYSGFDATTRTLQAGAGVRPDGLLVHAVADALTLPELALVFVELGCAAAMCLGGAGGPVYADGRIVHGADGPRFPCALVFKQAEPAPFLLQHLFGTQEPYRGSNILGAPVAGAQQMEAYSHLAHPAAPFYADLYLELGAALGVRGDVAYAQALHETNFFRYTGDVQAWQFNMAGLGATGAGARGAVFAGPREGIMAQLQHLFAYATAAPLPPGMPLADPRFGLVARGVAPRVGDLNGRWAVPGSSYGQSIDRLLHDLLAVPAAPVDDAAGRATLRALLAQRVQLGNAGQSDAPRHQSWQGTLLGPAGTAVLGGPDAGAPATGALPALPVPGALAGVGGSYYQVTLPSGDPGWVSAAEVTMGPAGPAGAPVVLDPGHGGPDTGAVGQDGTPEKAVNLAIALRLQQRLEAAGVRVLMTRAADADVALAARSALANQAGARLFLSLHNNAAGAGARGTETYLQGGEGQPAGVLADSRRLGCLLQQATLAAIRAAGGACPASDRGARIRLLSGTDPRDYYFVLRNTHVPAALVEVAFMSHPDELACLKDAAFQDAVAAGLAGAVLRYLGGGEPVEACPVRTLYGL